MSTATAMRTLLAEVASRIAAAPRLEGDVRDDAVREAQLLVAGVLDVAPGVVLQAAARDDTVTPPVVDAVRRATARRAEGEPLAYCVGHAAFRHLVLQVDARVLVPRPETEVVVDEVLRCTADAPGGVAVDIGTGSGAIALALATEGRFDRVIATDVSRDALDVARANARRVSPATPLDFRAGADLAPLAELRASGTRVRVLVSNPPYIAWAEAAALPSSVRDWEPSVALFADDDGMARYRVLLTGAPALLEVGGWVVLEVDARRGGITADLARQHGYDPVRLVRDYAGRDRVLVARWPGPRERATPGSIGQ